MDPKRKQGPGQVRRPAKPVSPVFKVGDYVPLAILIVAEDKLKNFHLPQKLYAVKDFVQADVMLEYFFQHPQQPLMLDPNHPKPAEFNGAVCNFSRWMVEKGYCRQEGGTDVISRVWTPEEMDVHRAEVKARRDAQILAHAEAMAANPEEEMVITEGINNLLGGAQALMEEGQKMYGEFEQAALEQDRPAVNVGTVGHVDHGLSIAARTVSDGGRAFERPEGASADEPEAYLAMERPDHQLDPIMAEALASSAPLQVVRTAPQYPLPATTAE